MIWTQGAYLDGLLVDLDRPPAETGEGPVGILPVHHDDVGTASGGDHLKRHGSDRERDRSKVIKPYLKQLSRQHC